jgi:hypothetical protein
VGADGVVDDVVVHQEGPHVAPARQLEPVDAGRGAFHEVKVRNPERVGKATVAQPGVAASSGYR